MSDRWDDIEPDSPADSALAVLIRELLLERTAALDGATLAAFIDGWTSVLDLLARVDLLLPGAPPELREGVVELIGRIRSAQLDALADDDLP